MDSTDLVFILDGSKVAAKDLNATKSQIARAVVALSRSRAGLPTPIIAPLPPGTSNAVDIAAKITASNIPGVTSINPIGNSYILFVLDTSPDPKNPSKSRDLSQLEAMLRGLVSDLAMPNPHLYVLPLPRGKGHACDIIAAIGRQVDGVLSMMPVDDSRILVGLDPTKDDETLKKELQGYIDQLAVPATPPSSDINSIAMRLYYDRDANSVATVVGNSFTDVKASAVDSDTVLINGPENGSTSFKRAQQMIAKIDQPRPQIALNTWALQLSSDRKGKHALDDLVPRGRRLANEYNNILQASVSRGWAYLTNQLQDPNFLDLDFSDYLTKQAELDALGCCLRIDPYSPGGNSRTRGYALGYVTLLKPLPPSVISMLIAVAASKNPRIAAYNVIDAVEKQHSPDPVTQNQVDMNLTPHNGMQCQEADAGFYKNFDKDHVPAFLAAECVRQALGALLARQGSPSTSLLGQFRAALADFLYQNKMIVEYPNDFDAWSYPRAAATLDSILVPLCDAFNSDMTAFQQDLLDKLTATFPNDKHLTYGASGLVAVKVIAGQPAIAETATANYFPQNPTMKLEDLASAIASNSASSASSPPALAGTLSSVVAAVAAYKTASPQQVTAKLGKGLAITATAHTLSSASGAELDIDVMSNENGAEMLSADASQAQPADDLASRVSEHHVNTHVRMESLKLFELSTMQSTLARQRTPWKPFDPVIELPLISSLGIRGVRKTPQIIYHQSLIFIDATIAPTSADLGQAMQIMYDRVPSAEHPFAVAETFSALGVDGSTLIKHNHERLLTLFASQYIDESGQIVPPLNPSSGMP